MSKLVLNALVQDLVRSTNYLHSKNNVHCDIKVGGHISLLFSSLVVSVFVCHVYVRLLCMFAWCVYPRVENSQPTSFVRSTQDFLRCVGEQAQLSFSQSIVQNEEHIFFTVLVTHVVHSVCQKRGAAEDANTKHGVNSNTVITLKVCRL